MNRRARGRIGGREAVVCARRTVNTPQPPQGGAGSAARLAALSFASHFMPRKNRAVRKEQENHQRSFRRAAKAQRTQSETGYDRNDKHCGSIPEVYLITPIADIRTAGEIPI